MEAAETERDLKAVKRKYDTRGNTRLSDILTGYHEVFSLEDGERGETGLRLTQEMPSQKDKLSEGYLLLLGKKSQNS